MNVVKRSSATKRDKKKTEDGLMFLEKYGDKITSTLDSSMVTFEIEDEELFYTTGYKVIQNFPGGGLIRATKSHHNGHIRLVYDVSELVPLAGVLSKMDPETFKGFALGIIELTEQIGKNGFIQGENVCLETDYIFVNPITAQVYLIYLPVIQNNSLTMQLDSMGKSSVELIKKILMKFPGVQGESTKELFDYLSENRCDREEIRKIILGKHIGTLPVPNKSVNQDATPSSDTNVPNSLILERIGGSQGLILRISAPAAVIGRDKGVSQVLISDVSVSKKHCLLCKESDGWMIEDLQSSNHTWLGEDSNPLVPYKQYAIKPGDTVKIARFVFLVKAGMGE